MTVHTCAILIRAACLGLLCSSGVASAAPRSQTPPRVVIMSMVRCCRSAAWPGVERRLAAELNTLGFQVRWTHATGPQHGAPGETLASLALAGQALAAVRILRRPISRVGGTPPGHRIIIAWHDRLTGKTSLRRGRVTNLDRRTEALVALQAVELLRASLLEVRANPARHPRELPPLPPKLLPAPRLATALPEHRRRWSVRVAASVLWIPGGLPVRSGVAVEARWRAGRWLSLELQADLTPFGEDLERLERRTSVQYYGGSLALLWEIQGVTACRKRRDWRLQPALGLLAGARLVHIRGWDTFDLHGRSQLRVQADLAAVAQLGIHIVGPVRLRASLQGGVLVPPIGVQYPTGRVATLGAGYVSGHFGLELAW